MQYIKYRTVRQHAVRICRGYLVCTPNSAKVWTEQYSLPMYTTLMSYHGQKKQLQFYISNPWIIYIIIGYPADMKFFTLFFRNPRPVFEKFSKICFFKLKIPNFPPKIRLPCYFILVNFNILSPKASLLFLKMGDNMNNFCGMRTMRGVTILLLVYYDTISISACRINKYIIKNILSLSFSVFLHNKLL